MRTKPKWMMTGGIAGRPDTEQLWEHLNGMGMVKGVKHPTFGDPDVQLQLLVKTR